jgi:hypothetical protein
VSELPFKLEDLARFIVEAKRHTYAGDGRPAPSSRPSSVDLVYERDDWRYHDSYFGTRDFMGNEIVYWRGQAVWGMIYYGRILQPVRLGELWPFLKRALQATYTESRFLGPSVYSEVGWRYEDTNQGTAAFFEGQEEIRYHGERVYRLTYTGGLLI